MYSGDVALPRFDVRRALLPLSVRARGFFFQQRHEVRESLIPDKKLLLPTPTAHCAVCSGVTRYRVVGRVAPERFENSFPPDVEFEERGFRAVVAECEVGASLVANLLMPSCNNVVATRVTGGCVYL